MLLPAGNEAENDYMHRLNTCNFLKVYRGVYPVSSIQEFFTDGSRKIWTNGNDIVAIQRLKRYHSEKDPLYSYKSFLLSHRHYRDRISFLFASMLEFSPSRRPGLQN